MVVNFHGSVTCANLGASSRVVDFVTQIGTDPNMAPSINDPGGLRHAIRIQPESGGNSDTFNLASTRAFSYTAGGTKTYYFKLAPLRRDALTRCDFYNLSFSLTFVAAAPANAGALIRFQAPCSTGNNACVTVPASQPLPKSIRSFAFAAPSAGRALVTFHGSMTCSHANSGSGQVEIVSQIGTDPNAAPTAFDPGGLLYRIHIPPDLVGNSDSFNLASTRAFAIGSSGNQTYYFKLRSGTRDPGTACSFYNLSFSVLFIPAGAAQVRFQAPCRPNSGECPILFVTSPVPKTLRSFSFDAPSAGTVLVDSTAPGNAPSRAKRAPERRRPL